MQLKKMQLCLFDTDKSRQRLWTAGCREHSFEISIHEELSREVLRSSSHGRIMVLDESVVGTKLGAAESIAKVLKQDVLVFSLTKPTCSRIMQWMACGAAWAVDNSFQRSGLTTELLAIVQLAREHEAKLKQFKKLDQLFSAISSSENEVLLFVLQGMQNNHIAEKLQVSVRTIESRRAKILQKIRVESLVGLVRSFDQYHALRKMFC